MLLAMLSVVAHLHGQQPGAASTTMEELARMEAQAGVVFAGEVVAIRFLRPGGLPGNEAGSQNASANFQSSGVVEVELRVDEAVLGCAAGGRYELREWGGLWMNKASRYRVGQRAVWMLYPPNAAGWSSPVGGMAGVLPLSGWGTATVVDLRWVQTRLMRTGSVGRAMDPAGAGAVAVTPLLPDYRNTGLAASNEERSALREVQPSDSGQSGSRQAGVAGEQSTVMSEFEQPRVAYSAVMAVLHGMRGSAHAER